MENHEYIVKTDGKVARIDINRPDEGNMISRPMMVSLTGLIGDLGRNADINVIAIEGRGEYFCKGRDGKGESREGMTPHDVRVQQMGAVLGVYDAINACPIPVVALVHGPAIGFGSALGGGADITLASDAARFSFPEIKHNIPPTLAMSAVLKKVPAKALSYLIYSGSEISAQEAVMFGLASRVLPAADFAREADAFLKELAGRPRVNLETIKLYQRHASEVPLATASEYAGTLLALVRGL
ncbi:MAG: hypothetical protein RLZ98_182 [Pseudomonadota bacterium]|jgi:enoyl-CoA hydratase/carnithine racemase